MNDRNEIEGDARDEYRKHQEQDENESDGDEFASWTFGVSHGGDAEYFDE
jgi:hypothetical protein